MYTTFLCASRSTAAGGGALTYNYYAPYITKLSRGKDKDNGAALRRSRYGLFQGLFNNSTGKYEKGNCPELLPDDVPVKHELGDFEAYLSDPEDFSRALGNRGARARAIKPSTWGKYVGLIGRVLGYAANQMNVPRQKLSLELFSNHRILHAVFEEQWRNSKKGTGVPNQVSSALGGR